MNRCWQLAIVSLVVSVSVVVGCAGGDPERQTASASLGGGAGFQFPNISKNLKATPSKVTKSIVKNHQVPIVWHCTSEEVITGEVCLHTFDPQSWWSWAIGEPSKIVGAQCGGELSISEEYGAQIGVEVGGASVAVAGTAGIAYAFSSGQCEACTIDVCFPNFSMRVYTCKTDSGASAPGFVDMQSGDIRLGTPNCVPKPDCPGCSDAGTMMADAGSVRTGATGGGVATAPVGHASSDAGVDAVVITPDIHGGGGAASADAGTTTSVAVPTSVEPERIVIIDATRMLEDGAMTSFSAADAAEVADIVSIAQIVAEGAFTHVALTIPSTSFYALAPIDSSIFAASDFAASDSANADLGGGDVTVAASE